MATKDTRVLFLCTGNSARSQMAEAFLRSLAGDRFEVCSAGLDPRPIDPFVHQVMGEVGLDLSGHRSKNVREFLGKKSLTYLITVWGRAERDCASTFPGIGQQLRWSFDDPAAERGGYEERLAKFRAIRDQIERRIRAWLVGQGPVLAVAGGRKLGYPSWPTPEALRGECGERREEGRTVSAP